MAFDDAPDSPRRGSNPWTIPLWTIVRCPPDHPDHFVARQIELYLCGTLRVTGAVHCALTLTAVRAMLPPGLRRLDRDPADAPHIVESWI
jgi:hypothetical protein